MYVVYARALVAITDSCTLSLVVFTFFGTNEVDVDFDVLSDESFP